ncbi:MAG: hypothetical protein V4581_16745 [Bacteroidota bacterium]
MKYNELKDGMSVSVYIPACNTFYKMQVAKTVNESEFSISNLCLSKHHRIEGHEYRATVKSQEDVDAFFYMHKGKVDDIAHEMAQEHYKQNTRDWIFPGGAFKMKTVNLT